ncbi:hypothetical protein [Novosphingobium album (ex Liu et al. 2023)]|uniref:Acyl-protein synthetase LuxE domain-containing protein n=1 Tax=Novosphingobium album (ex Liu et al. 2023) TaxID=3031130 RepID=A0ABT5WPL6_9SPHN|nr:hypothetical protein [Novosphingobium album (ex Liu et al. 2023)]MDE8651995.1 hypothetical protein [Novosphingobium album (ex Liu et al. 2023)]
MATMATSGKQSAVEQLTALLDAPDAYDTAHEAILPLQIEAAQALFVEQVEAIKLLGNRARSGNVDAIRSAADIVPLLFAHTAYKSYPESWLTERKWDRLGKWLETVSATPVTGVDLTDVTDIDDWLGRLQAAGHFVSCSSGTTGKCAMLDATAQDLAWAQREVVRSISWGANIEAAQDRRLIGTGAVAHSARNNVTKNGIVGGFSRLDVEPYQPPVPPITIGAITGMVAMRKAIGEGTASPDDIAAFEETSAARAAAVEASYDITADALIEARGDKLFILGMWAGLHRVAMIVRERGYGAKDFHPDNALYVGGGLKGAVLPPDYRQFISETFNLSPEREFHMYGMQEINAALPRCQAGRYHVPPWVMLLLLDEPGETLVEPTPGIEQEGRAAFFDFSVRGRWGGVISGDKIMADYGPCACGAKSPSIRDNIVRYADQVGGDKISCSGTIDAYVRGAA